jgi:copper chaperone CopZ
MKLESIEDDLPGVKRVEASYQKQSMLVEFDDSKIGMEDIQKAVEKLGYTVKI